MISLKAALVAAAAVGTATVGGVTYAAVGASQGDLAASHEGLPTIGAGPAKPSVPALPDCLPTTAAQKLAAKVPTGVPAGVPTGVPAGVPTGVPTQISGKVPTSVPTAFGTTIKVPTAKVPGAAASCLKAPAGVPTGVPTPAVGASSVPTSKLPVQSVPALPKLDCAKVTSVVQTGSKAEQSLALPNGLHFDATRTVSRTFMSRKICDVGQTWQDRAGQWVKLDRFKGEATLEQIRQAMRLPQLQPVTMGGTTVWESPLGVGQGDAVVIWSPEPGVALSVSTSPAYQYRLTDITARLLKIGG